MSGIQQTVVDGLQYMQNCVAEGRYESLEDEADQEAFKEDLQEMVLDKLEE